ncbi:MAG TPA: hypothetical protein DEG43_12330, partial [Acidimicrobiaceae bacterium]|nr:hypothetical protein [Acidimicrobiaceae bacterium]
MEQFDPNDGNADFRNSPTLEPYNLDLPEVDTSASYGLERMGSVPVVAEGASTAQGGFNVARPYRPRRRPAEPMTGAPNFESQMGDIDPSDLPRRGSRFRDEPAPNVATRMPAMEGAPELNTYGSVQADPYAQ